MTAPAITIRDFAVRKLGALCRALAAERLLPEALRAFDALSASWAGFPLPAKNPWPTDISDDGSPFELSVAFGSSGPVLRLLSESQCLPMTASSTWRAGLELQRRLASEHGADLSQLERVLDLFTPAPGVASRFLIWHAVMVAAEPLPREAVRSVFKVYLNPGLDGSAQAPGVVDEALARLGLDAARGFLKTLGARSSISYFSLDLEAAAEARVKVYVDHPGMPAAYVDEQVRGAANIGAGQAERWLNELTGEQAASSERPFQTCFAFRTGRPAPDVTVSVPLRFYVGDDAEALQRVRPFLEPGNAALLEAALAAVAERPLALGRGLVSYVSLRPEGQHLRSTFYLSPEMYAVATPRPRSGVSPRPAQAVPSPEPGAGWRMADVKAVIRRRQQRGAQHPFLERVQSSNDLRLVRAIAPRVGFFVLAFQDVQRLVHEHTRDPFLKELARVHRQEDAGHDGWYLGDLQTLGVPVGITELFSAEHARVRELSYRALADAVRLGDDRSRLSLVLALEAAGQLYFGAVIGLLDRLGLASSLRYFGREHAAAESGHEVFGAGGDAVLRDLEVPAAAVPEVLDVIERTFQTIDELGDELEQLFR